MEYETSSSDIDNDLLQKLNTLGTRDKEDLICQFQSVVGTQLTHRACGFYLEMGNWNLQTALGAYYDVMSSPEKLPIFSVLEESEHVGENSTQPSQWFLKSWRLQNIGIDTWPNNLKLKFTNGTNFGHGECVALPPLDPNETTDVSITMTAPFNEGIYEGNWRVTTLSGIYCGNTLNVVVNVDKTDMTSLTDQMSSLGQHLRPIPAGVPTQPMLTPSRPEIQPTPFCSPTGYGIFGGSGVANMATNGQLPIINEGMNIIDENELPDRTRVLHDCNDDVSDS